MVAEPVHTALLAATPPFALSASLRALSAFAPCAGDQAVEGDRVRKAFPLSATEAAVVEVGPRPDGTPGVALTVFAPRPLSGGEGTGGESAGRRRLGLEDDLAPVPANAPREP